MSKPHQTSVLVVVFAIIAVVFTSFGALRAIEIGTMTWTPRADWINVKSCTTLTGAPNATGNGTTDDTAALQGVLTYLHNNPYYYRLTVYFPPGTYKISSTLKMSGVWNAQFIGSGSATTIKWAGASGQAMYWADGTGLMRYIGLVWDGSSLANCAYEECSSQGQYESQIRHENESFKNFTQTSTYTFTDQNGTVHTPDVPAAAIDASYAGAGLLGEMEIFNCHFTNCTTGLINAYNVTNNFEWNVEGCEFDSCGTGINFGGGYCYIVANCHFQGSTVGDFEGGGSIRVHHCTSSGSVQFMGVCEGINVLQDCWIDGWTDIYGAVTMVGPGPNKFYDCNFTHPPSGSMPPIEDEDGSGTGQNILLSNNYAPGFSSGAGIVNSPYGVSYRTTIVPSGMRTGIVTSPTQTFLKTANFVDSTHILDVTQSPYTADKTGSVDSTATIQAAINAAETANNGTIVYIPGGIYKITSTLTLSGSNFTVQGAGFLTELAWYGGSNGTIMTVTTPNNIAVTLLRLAAFHNLPSDPANYNSSYITSDETTITGIKETSTGVSNVIYDDVHYNGFTWGNPGASYGDANGPGLVLSNLPAGTTVTMPHVEATLTVQNCGAAQIFANFLQFGEINVSGTGAKTGFLGVDDAEGAQMTNSAGYNVTVTDDQNLALGDYYTEEAWNDFLIESGSGTTTGWVTIEGMSTESGQSNGVASPTQSLNVSNYAGRVYYDCQSFIDEYGDAPVKVTQSGANAVDMDIAVSCFYDGAPTMTLGSGANLIETLNQNVSSSGVTTYMPDVPNPLTATSLRSMANGFDNLRQLGELDAFTNFGIAELISNNGFEADAMNPSPATTLGYNPGSWTVVNALAAGSGVRNATVVSGGSPFGSGGQSLDWLDTTGSSTGSGLLMVESFTASPASSPAIETFDFCCSTTATSSDVWLSSNVGTGADAAAGVHITSNGSTVWLGANVDGSDHLLTTLTAGTWYRARVVMAAPSGGKSNATFYITPWSGTGPGTTISYTIDGIPEVEAAGFYKFGLSAGSPAGVPENVRFDNIGLVTNATLTLP